MESREDYLTGMCLKILVYGKNLDSPRRYLSLRRRPLVTADRSLFALFRLAQILPENFAKASYRAPLIKKDDSICKLEIVDISCSLIDTYL